MNILFGSAKNNSEVLLKSRGYKIVGRNRRASIVVRLDGKEHLGDLTAEYLAEKNGQRYVVWGVKGDGEKDPTEPALRRRLVELSRAFGLNRILLVDAEAGEIGEVGFAFPRERGLDFYFQFLTGLFIVGAVIGIIWLMVYLKMF